MIHPFKQLRDPQTDEYSNGTPGQKNGLLELFFSTDPFAALYLFDKCLFQTVSIFVKIGLSSHPIIGLFL
jgi:hypothetical protein